jgi:hypothetical protein
MTARPSYYRRYVPVTHSYAPSCHVLAVTLEPRQPRSAPHLNLPVTLGGLAVRPASSERFDLSRLIVYRYVIAGAPSPACK